MIGRFGFLRATLGLIVIAASFTARSGAGDESKLVLHARSRTEAKPGSGEYQAVERELSWAPRKTAIVICDMWDQHWCRGASARVAEMAPAMNEMVKAARQRGMLIIHCPSGCLDAYKDTPMRAAAQSAPRVETTIPLQSWCRLDPKHEAPLPIDDSDGGCDCWPQCPQGSPWKKQIATIEICPDDAVTDSAEAFYLMKQRGIENVIVMGVHANMCVLGRPFSIRQMVNQGQQVVLVRDMTDTMYNSRMRPFVPHVRGTDLIVEHIEKYWCPTIASTDFTGKPAFRFSEDGKPHVVLMISEPEYRTDVTLPAFAKKELETRGLRCTVVMGDPQHPDTFPGLNALKTADLLILSVRRRALPADQLQLVRDYLNAGKPLVGIRTACHAFHTRGTRDEGHDEWQSFDPEVLGGNYQGHHGVGEKVALKIADGAAGDPILKGFVADSFVSNGSLYRVNPLASTTHPLLIGRIPGQPEEPVAWTNAYHGGRIFYTSLGHEDDFANEQFRRLLVNSVFWALGREVVNP